jgi:ankyrin repeat protein
MDNKKQQELYEKYKDSPQEALDTMFLGACYHGNLEQVKFFLTYPNLKKHVNIHADDDLAFYHACSEGRLEVVKYLLSSKELKENVNIHTENDIGFRAACACQQLEVVKYFIFDCDIKKTKDIKEYLKRKPNEQVRNMFKIRDINKSLEKELVRNEDLSKKMKV